MDHVLLKISQYYEIYLEDFISEQLSKNHKHYKDNSHYEELKAIIDSMNPLRVYLGLPKLNLSTEVKLVLEGVKDEY